MNKRSPLHTSLLILSIVLLGLTGCAAPATQTPATQPADLPTQPAAEPTEPAAQPAPALPSGWQTYSASTDQGQCGYAISHPADMQVASQNTYSWLLNRTTTEPVEAFPNFIYVSVIPDDMQNSEPGTIYNYDPAVTQTLLAMQVSESGPIHDVADLADWYTYTRLPDTQLGGQSAQAYENLKPWEFPTGTNEIRYYLKANGCTYLVGGYMSAAGLDQPGAMDEELFNQIIATFRLES